MKEFAQLLCGMRLRESMWKKEKYITTKYRVLLGVILFYIPFHFLISPTYWDDASYAQILGQYQNDLFRYTMDRYMLRSSRITIELILPFLTTWPSFIWKVLDLLMIALLYCDLVWILEHFWGLQKKQMYLLTGVLLCAFPFSIMAQTGWIATTTNYLWVISLGLYVINRMLKAGVLKEKLLKSEILYVTLALFYCASFESMSVILFLIEIGLLIYCVKNKEKCPLIVWICMCLTVIFLIYIFCCPGNRMRFISDAKDWMPEYFELTFLDKLRMGVLSSYMHFVSLPSPIFFILNIIIFLLWKGESVGKRLMAALPMITDVAWTGWFMLNYLLGWRTLTYQVPTPLPDKWSDKVEQGLLLLTVAVWFVIVFYTLFNRKKQALAVILILACLPEMAVGLTSTVVASILRTMIYLYMAMILLIVVMMETREEKWTVSVNYFLWFCMGAGIFLNACQISRHILLYG